MSLQSGSSMVSHLRNALSLELSIHSRLVLLRGDDAHGLFGQTLGNGVRIDVRHETRLVWLREHLLDLVNLSPGEDLFFSKSGLCQRACWASGSERITSRVRRITGVAGFGRGTSRERTSSALASISGASVIASARAGKARARERRRARFGHGRLPTSPWRGIFTRRDASRSWGRGRSPSRRRARRRFAKALDMTFELGACVPSPTNAARQ